jgi:hypothetical protein
MVFYYNIKVGLKAMNNYDIYQIVAGTMSKGIFELKLILSTKEVLSKPFRKEYL